MSTYVSGLAPYCTTDQWISFCDVRTLCQLVSDTGHPIQAGALPANQVALDTLQAASGWVESACTKGGRYQITTDVNNNDLANLIGNSAMMLAWLVAWIGYWILWSRRPNRDDKLPAQVEQAMKMLDALESGDAVFGVLEVMEAGSLSSHVEVAAEVEARRQTTLLADRYFGRRGNRMNG